MGGDDAPAAPVAGALEAIRTLSVDLTLVGATSAVESELARHTTGPRPRIVEAPEVIGMSESPVHAVRAKKQSSMVVGIELVARGEADAFVTAGNTGAAMAASPTIVIRLPAASTRFRRMFPRPITFFR